MLQEFFRVLEAFTEINAPGLSMLVDFFPILRRLPAALYPPKRKAILQHEYEKQFYRPFYLKAKHAILNRLPSARSCFCEDVVALQQQESLSDDFAMFIPIQFFEAGSETTSSEMYGFSQAMLLYPATQRRGQAEVDALCGDSRCPTLADIDKLPYVRACVKETLRWMPATILGASPHALIQDEEFMGYHLPKGASITLNVWTIHRDPHRYPNPTEFCPERFLGDTTSSSESAALPDVSQRDHFGFGAGRRICPGMHVADSTLLLAVASMLWALNFSPKMGEDGQPILPLQDQFDPRFAVHPKDFEVEVTPRNEKRAALVREMWDGARQELDEKGQFLKNPI